MTSEQTAGKLAWLDMMIRFTVSLIESYEDDEDWVRDCKPQNVSNIDEWLEERLRLMKQNEENLPDTSINLNP